LYEVPASFDDEYGAVISRFSGSCTSFYG